MEVTFVTHKVFHELTSWLNAVAPWNIDVKLVAAAAVKPGAQLEMLELNAVAPWNIDVKFVTSPTFQRFADVFIFEFDTPEALPLLNAMAFWNIEVMFVARCVSQLLRSWLKRVAPENIEVKLVTLLTSHVEIFASLNVEAPKKAKLILVMLFPAMEAGTLESEVQL